MHHFPPPKGDASRSLRALIIDCWFDPYHGAVVMTRVFDGPVQKGTKIRMMSSGRSFEVLRLGVYSPGPGGNPRTQRRRSRLYHGRHQRSLRNAHRRYDYDWTIIPRAKPLPGFKPMKPMVFSGLYPTESDSIRRCATRWKNSVSTIRRLHIEPETSQALGFGFRCGFLGLLHMDIVRERLEREFSLSLITTAATVVYRVTTAGEVCMIDNPVQAAQRGGDRADRRADDPGDDALATGISRRGA